MKISVFNEPHRGSPWGVIHYLDSRAVRRFFNKEAAAHARKDALDAAFASGGQEAVRRFDVDIDLEKAQELAVVDGRSVLELVRLGIAAGRRGPSGPTLFEAYFGFEARHAEVKLRPKTVTFYAEQLGGLRRAIGDAKRTSELTRPLIREWIDKKPIASRPHALRACKAWIRWMQRQEPPLIETDPTAGMAIDTPIEERRIAFLTGAESKALLEACDARIRAAAALMLFAGIRHNELHRDGQVSGVDVLRWEDIDFAHRTITVRADVAKTRVARTLRKLPGNLWAWLAPRLDAGPVCAGHLRKNLTAARAKANLGPKWSKSILRHTCASHHAAAFGNLSATALLIRHEGDVTLLNRRYREGVSISKADGKAFFAILPAA